MEAHLSLFEKIIQKQVEVFGRDAAYAQARDAGLSLTESGKVFSAAGNPHTILLRLLKTFTATDNVAALEECTALINDFLKNPPTTEPVR